MTSTSLPAWRSLLYVPADVPHFIESAHTRGADAIVLDLEDAVAAERKAYARASVAEAARRVSQGGADVVVRINRPLPLALLDIAASVGPRVAALALPKILGADHIRLLSEVVAESEARAGIAIGSTRFIVMIETAYAALRMQEIAASSDRIVALTLGTEDFATDLGVEPDAPMLDTCHANLVASAIAANLVPLGLTGSIAQFRDAEAFAALARRSRAFGYRGAACIHPSQIAALHAAFTPERAEVERAKAMLAAFDAALTDGRGAISHEGRMIDRPVAERARALVAAYDAVSSSPEHA